MATTTPNMGLTRWDLSSDPYDHSQLSANFNAIDLHDHSSGKGLQIGTAGILPNAITSALIATGAVTTAQILDGTITAADLANGLFDIVSPLGSVLYWWRPSVAVTDLETSSGGRWVLANGRTLTAAQHNFPGGGSIVLPEARHAYPLGADLAGTGSTPGLPPAIGAIVGNTGNVINLNHTHTVNAHTHTVAGHSHTVNAHFHNVSGHTHSISSDGDHFHHFWNGIDFSQPLSQRGGATSTGSTFQAAYVTSLNSGNNSSVSIPMETVGAHTHGGSTGASSTTTDSQSPGTNSVGLTSDSTSPTTGNPSVDQSAVDIRPNSVGFLCYLKVKY